MFSRRLQILRVCLETTNFARDNKLFVDISGERISVNYSTLLSTTTINSVASTRDSGNDAARISSSSLARQCQNTPCPHRTSCLPHVPCTRDSKGPLKWTGY